jgi:hypothetical protein
MCANEREREKKIVWVCLLSSICTIAFARSYTQCVHIRFIVEKKTTKREREREEKKDAKKDIQNIC